MSGGVSGKSDHRCAFAGPRLRSTMRGEPCNSGAGSACRPLFGGGSRARFHRGPRSNVGLFSRLNSTQVKSSRDHDDSQRPRSIFQHCETERIGATDKEAPM
jgi:hypothetical protein